MDPLNEADPDDPQQDELDATASSEDVSDDVSDSPPSSQLPSSDVLSGDEVRDTFAELESDAIAVELPITPPFDFAPGPIAPAEDASPPPIDEHNEMVEAFLLEGLDKPFHKATVLGERGADFLTSTPDRVRTASNRADELTIPIVHQKFSPQFRGFGLPEEERRRLFFHPGTVRVICRRGDNNSTSTNVQKKST